MWLLWMVPGFTLGLGGWLASTIKITELHPTNATLDRKGIRWAREDVIGVQLGSAVAQANPGDDASAARSWYVSLVSNADATGAEREAEAEAEAMREGVVGEIEGEDARRIMRSILLRGELPLLLTATSDELGASKIALLLAETFDVPILCPGEEPSITMPSEIRRTLVDAAAHRPPVEEPAPPTTEVRVIDSPGTLRLQWSFVDHKMGPALAVLGAMLVAPAGLVPFVPLGHWIPLVAMDAIFVGILGRRVGARHAGMGPQRAGDRRRRDPDQDAASHSTRGCHPRRGRAPHPRLRPSKAACDRARAPRGATIYPT